MVTTPRLRRRKYFIVRVGDDLVFDVRRFLQGNVETCLETRCTLLCPLRGSRLPLSLPELALVMMLPADRWVSMQQLVGLDEQARERLNDLSRRGIILSDPPREKFEDLASGEAELDHMQWEPLAAVYHAHSSWRGVSATSNATRPGAEDSIEALRQLRGDPPPHFVERTDAHDRIPLERPELVGTFFDVLLARRTTRAFRLEQPLPLSALASILYAVFGAQGIRSIVDGIAAIKRTSPSAGALHPIEAYVLVINVEGAPAGIYHYEGRTHTLAQLERLDREGAQKLAGEFTAGQEYFTKAHVLVIHVAFRY